MKKNSGFQNMFVIFVALLKKEKRIKL